MITPPVATRMSLFGDYRSESPVTYFVNNRWIAIHKLSRRIGETKERRAAIKLELCRSLLKYLGLGGDGSFSVQSNSLGRPSLSINGSPGPSVSFTRDSSFTWAAISADSQGLGIDSAEVLEFDGAYPFRRAFTPCERTYIKGGLRETASSAALLWSAKEAAVKMLGCGFRFVDPAGLEVKIIDEAGNLCSSRANFPDTASIVKYRKINVVSKQTEAGWLSLCVA